MTETVIGIAGAILGVVFSYLAFARGKAKDDKSDGQQIGVITSELGYIKANTDEIKNEQREQRKINTELYTRVSAVESSAKQAHLRIDRMEGREYPGAHE